MESLAFVGMLIFVALVFVVLSLLDILNEMRLLRNYYKQLADLQKEELDVIESWPKSDNVYGNEKR